MKKDKCPLCELGLNMRNFELSIYDDTSSHNKYDQLDEDCISGGINIKDDVLYYDNSGIEYSRDAVKINYCPMCGRKLKEE